MKNFYTTLLMFFAFVSVVEAQITVIDFTDASYDAAAAQTNLSSHPDWTNSTTPGWKADGTNNRLSVLKANFKICNYGTTVSNAVAGNVISVKALIQLGANTQAFQDAESYILMALQSSPLLTGSNNTNRDGVILKSGTVANNTVFLSGQGASSFGTDPSISQATKDVYEIFFEMTLGADAATTTINARIKNTVSNETSPIQSLTGINASTYTALTSSTGAYLFFYTFNPWVGAEGTDYNITNVFINRIEVGKTTTPQLLSVNTNSKVEFNAYPNPVNDILFINSKESISNVKVYDLVGKEVLNVNNNLESIDMSSLDTGIYLVKITSEKGVSTKKIIKE